VELLHANDLPDMYVVENTDSNGINIWLSEFAASEIKSV
jgi:hypothetical protein